MSCPTCDHTMHNVVSVADPTISTKQVFWCPRCGTLETFQDIAAPKLVEKARDVLRFEDFESDIGYEQYRDMEECCRQPKDREWIK